MIVTLLNNGLCFTIDMHCYTTGTIVKRVLLYNGYCHTTGIVIQRVLFYNGYCYTTATALQRPLV